MTFSIGGVEIGGSNPCRFVAELSNNHNGDSDRFVRLVKAAKAAGADIVKTQCFAPSELVALRGDGPAPEPWGSQGFTMRSLYEKAQTPLEWFEWIPEVCGAVGIDWFSSVFGAESLAVLERAGCPAYKIARLDNAHVALIDAVEKTRKPFIVSAADHERPLYNRSGWDHTDPAYLARFVSPRGGWAVPLMMFCPVGYPQTKFGFRRGAAATDYDDFGTDGTFDGHTIGFSYHGTSIEPSVVAATLGAKIIEAHFQLDEERSELENHVSLRASDFRAMVDRVRRVEEMLG